MKILHVTPFLTPARGGSAIIPYKLSRELSKRGHDVTLITTDFELDEKYAHSLSDVEIVKFKCVINLSLFLYSPDIKKWCTENLKNFDIVHLHDFRSYQNIIIHHYAKKHGIPYVLQPRGAIPRISKGKQKKLFDILFGWSIIKDATKIIASSRLESNQYWDVFPDLKSEKIVHTPNGIELEVYQNLPKKGEFRKKYSIAEDEKVILFLSRIHKRKGADILIEAFCELKNELEKVKLVIAGPDDGYLNRLKLRVKELNIEADVIFPGPLYGADKLEAYVDADVFVLPSINRYESFGNVALEACACGTPTIVTNVCGVSEWLDSLELIDPDVNSLYGKILEMLEISESERVKMGKKAQQEVRNLSWENVVENIEKIYQAIVEGRK